MKKGALFLKDNRLLKKSDFSSMRTNSFYIAGEGFVFVCKSSSNACVNSRLGLAVSSKVGNAVKRNKIKRLVREEFRKTSFDNPFDFLFIPKKSIEISKLGNNLKIFFAKSKEF